MQPPPFNPYEQSSKKSKKSPWVIVFVILGILLVCCGLPVIGAGVFGAKAFKGAMKMGGCIANTDRMAEALRKYAENNNGKLPKASEWQVSLAKYFPAVTEDMKQAPMDFWSAEGEWSCSEGDGKTGFAFNSKMSEKSIKGLKLGEANVAIFETNEVKKNNHSEYKPLDFKLSPLVLGGMSGTVDEHRGWMIVDASGDTYFIGKDGKPTKTSMNKYKVKASGGPIQVGASGETNQAESDSKEGSDFDTK